MNAKEIVKGDFIKVVTGEWYEVQFVYDNMIYVYDHNNAIHITKIIAVSHAQ